MIDWNILKFNVDALDSCQSTISKPLAITSQTEGRTELIHLELNAAAAVAQLEHHVGGRLQCPVKRMIVLSNPIQNQTGRRDFRIVTGTTELTQELAVPERGVDGHRAV